MEYQEKRQKFIYPVEADPGKVLHQVQVEVHRKQDSSKAARNFSILCRNYLVFATLQSRCFKKAYVTDVRSDVVNHTVLLHSHHRSIHSWKLMKVALILQPQEVWQRGYCKYLCSAQEVCWSKTWQLSGFLKSAGHNLSTRTSWAKLSNLWHLSAKLEYAATFPAQTSFYKEVSKVIYLCMKSLTEILNFLTLLHC